MICQTQFQEIQSSFLDRFIESQSLIKSCDFLIRKDNIVRIISGTFDCSEDVAMIDTDYSVEFWQVMWNFHQVGRAWINFLFFISQVNFYFFIQTIANLFELLQVIEILDILLDLAIVVINLY